MNLIEPHSPRKFKHYSWPYCTKCGLVYMSTPISKWMQQMGCKADEHPQFKQKVRSLT